MRREGSTGPTAHAPRPGASLPAMDPATDRAAPSPLQRRRAAARSPASPRRPPARDPRAPPARRPGLARTSSRRRSGRAGPASSSSSGRSRRPHFVSRETVRHGVGRPRHLYDVTADAQELFPSNYDGLAAGLLAAIGAVGGDALVEQVFQARRRQIGDRVRRELDERVGADALADRSGPGARGDPGRAGLPRRRRRRAGRHDPPPRAQLRDPRRRPRASARRATRSSTCSARSSAPTSSARRTSRAATAAARTGSRRRPRKPRRGAL